MPFKRIRGLDVDTQGLAEDVERIEKAKTR